ncbi:MAG: hypothetical protein U5K43_15325 [Halofilum sp. (in: g-proteobacteria)]|nr:hypothetical protein [Halofilum sp. (in: g-proteobacteria)]
MAPTAVARARARASSSAWTGASPACLEALDAADAADDDEGSDDGDGGDCEAVAQALATLRRRRGALERLGEEMAAAGESSRALTDPDSTEMRAGRGKWVIGYNVQFAVEAGRALIVHHEVVSDANDRGQLVPMARGAQTALGGGTLTVVADTGYAQAEGARARAPPRRSRRSRRAETPRSHWPGFARACFVYDAEADTSACSRPGRRCRFRGEVRGQRRYTTPAHAASVRSLKAQCTSGRQRQVSASSPRGRAGGDGRPPRAQRSGLDALCAGATGEHPFGTLKRGQQARPVRRAAITGRARRDGVERARLQPQAPDRGARGRGAARGAGRRGARANGRGVMGPRSLVTPARTSGFAYAVLGSRTHSITEPSRLPWVRLQRDAPGTGRGPVPDHAQCARAPAAQTRLRRSHGSAKPRCAPGRNG